MTGGLIPLITVPATILRMVLASYLQIAQNAVAISTMDRRRIRGI